MHVCTLQKHKSKPIFLRLVTNYQRNDLLSYLRIILTSQDHGFFLDEVAVEVALVSLESVQFQSTNQPDPVSW